MFGRKNKNRLVVTSSKVSREMQLVHDKFPALADGVNDALFQLLLLRSIDFPGHDIFDHLNRDPVFKNLFVWATTLRVGYLLRLIHAQQFGAEGLGIGSESTIADQKLLDYMEPLYQGVNPLQYEAHVLPAFAAAWFWALQIATTGETDQRNDASILDFASIYTAAVLGTFPDQRLKERGVVLGMEEIHWVHLVSGWKTL